MDTDGKNKKNKNSDIKQAVLVLKTNIIWT